MNIRSPGNEGVARSDTLKNGDAVRTREITSVDIPQPAAKAHSARRKWLVVLLCAIVVLGGTWIGWRRHENAASVAAAARKGTPPVTVVAGTVAAQNVPIYLDGLGTVQAFNTVTVHVRVDGELKKIAFAEGQTVHAGDVLAQIDPAPYQAVLDQSLAKKGQDEASLNLQRVELKREATLLAEKIDSQDQYDQVAAQVKELEAAVTADEAAIDNARVQLAYTTLTSPIDGRVGIRQVDVGNIVHATDANGIVVITQLHPISVIFTLPEQTLSEIHYSETRGDLKVLAVSGDNNKVLDTGSLAVIDNEIDPTTATIRLKANFPNKDLQLWPGQFVNARLLLTTRTNGIVVPASVIQRGPSGSYAFVINNDLSVSVQPVTVAQMENGQALIDTGLRPGQQVVVDGQYKLQAGSRVQLARAVERPRRWNRPGRSEPVNVSEPFIHRPVATSLLMAGVVLMGMLGYFLLPISALPPVDFPTIQVTAQYPGASPGRDGFLGHDAARTAVRADQRPGHDDLRQFLRQRRRSRCNSISTATSTRRRRTSRRPSTPPAAYLPEEHAQPAGLQQSQSRRHADPHAGRSPRTPCRWRR